MRRGQNRFGTTRVAAMVAILIGCIAAFPEVGSRPALASEELAHPLDPLTAVEYRAVTRVLSEEGHLDESALFPLITLEEPDKGQILSWKSGEPVSRRALAVVMKSGRTFEAVVDLVQGSLDSWREIPDVQPGILLTEEWTAAQEIVRAHPGWRSAVRERGIEELEAVVPVPLTVGFFGDTRERGERLVKVVSFDSRGVGNYWGRPIEGLVALVSLGRGAVIELRDTGPVPIPAGPVDFDPESVGEPRQPTRPITIERPEGVSFELVGHIVRWQKWSFHWRIDPRLGLVVSLVRYDDSVGERSVLYQGSLSEMFVPYTDPDESWYFRGYMDAGEYGIGKLSSQLEPGLDCPPNAAYFDALFADDWGNAYQAPRAACLFERYAGDVAWRHHEAVTGRTEVRRRTELVLRQVPAVGNYDYILDWVFRQNGSILVSVGSTGVPQVRAVASRDLSAETSARDSAHGRMVAEHTVAIHHDHWFCFRLDLDVDGGENSLLVERLVARRLGDKEPRTTTWVVEGRTAATEEEAKLTIRLDRPAQWRVIHPERRGPLGYPTSYQLLPGRNTVSLFGADDILQQRAGFIGHHLWVTPYSARERYAAGAYPNQSRGGEGLPRWTSRDRPIEKTDIVLWYTMGMHHVVRTEDWPVMPTSTMGFELRPFDFFAGNPALDLPVGER